MKKAYVLLPLTILALIVINNNVAFARENEQRSNFSFNNKINNRFENGKEKFFLKQPVNKDTFILKGVINATSSGSFTIDTKVINIDQSVTRDVKIVGNVQTGSYAMVQGIIKNSNYYATKIVIDQRNKLHTENDKDLDATHSPTASKSAFWNRFENNFKLNNNFVQNIQNLVDFLKNWLSTI